MSQNDYQTRICFRLVKLVDMYVRIYQYNTKQKICYVLSQCLTVSLSH